MAIACVMTFSGPLYRRNKVVNHFSIMLQQRLCEEDEEGEKLGEKKKKKKGRGRVGNLRIHDLEEELEMSNDSDWSVGDGKYRRPLTSPSPVSNLPLNGDGTTVPPFFFTQMEKARTSPRKTQLKAKERKGRQTMRL